jgi:hypothetical protein
MPEYIAGLCRMEGSELVPFDTMKFFADNHDEAVRQAVEWLSSTERASRQRGRSHLHQEHKVPAVRLGEVDHGERQVAWICGECVRCSTMNLF